MRLNKDEVKVLKKCILGLVLKLEQYEMKIELGVPFDYDVYCRLIDKHDTLCEVLAENEFLPSYNFILPSYVESLGVN